MIIIDCYSPLTQRILEIKLKDFIYFNENSSQIIITDRKNLSGNNIIFIDFTLNLDFEKIIEQIKQLENMLKNKNITPIIKDNNIIESEILKLISEHNSSLEIKIRRMLEK